MKIGVNFNECNTGDFLGHRISLSDNPEYYVVLQTGDKLLNDGTLVRDGLHYTQIIKMNSFRGVSFVNNDDFDEADIIICKLIKA